MREAGRALAVCSWLLLAAPPAWAQVDIAGNWQWRGGEETRALGGEGAHIGDLHGRLGQRRDNRGVRKASATRFQQFAPVTHRIAWHTPRFATLRSVFPYWLTR